MKITDKYEYVSGFANSQGGSLLSGATVNIKREVFAAIQHGARIDDRTGKVVKARSPFYL